MQPPAPPALPALPANVERVLSTLWRSGHAAYVVGGGLRDTLLGRSAQDWDVATSALPETVAGLFAASRYENRFGTVTVPGDSAGGIEITTFRRDHQYADHRRPDSVTFTDSLDADLARRDFTVNAIAWGKRSAGDSAGWADPAGGRADLDARVIRAVGDPTRRFDEDALRLLRAARFAAQLGFTIEPTTLDAMSATADTISHVSRERVGMELRKMLRADPPSAAFRILAETGVLAGAVPELDAQRGVPQEKATGDDLWGHCLRTVDAAAGLSDDETLRLAALLHDIGKPPTFADGHFIGHDSEGAKLADALLTRLAYQRRVIDEVVVLIDNHMFSYESRWSGAAIRRFIRRVGREHIAALLDLRRADNVGSGLPANAGHLDELESRIRAELEAKAPLTLRELAIDGNDLVTELGIAPSPQVGELLERLLNEVLADPSRNTREALLGQVRDWSAI
ncbi:MAG TPA: HD domain-containing protein [Candidatus Limnocylindrales bacterium]|nr:HD domain-containing protein [Candidatus Limnocylindrales bacterium]